jgi:mRNA interferase RelE/StbE
MTERPLYTVEFSERAAKSLDKLPAKIFDRVSKAADELEINPRPNGCKKLEGKIDTYRIRVGDYRIVYRVEDKKLFVLVIDVDHRSRVYKRR